jgi:hypothetical protein
MQRNEVNKAKQKIDELYALKRVCRKGGGCTKGACTANGSDRPPPHCKLIAIDKLYHFIGVFEHKSSDA